MSSYARIVGGVIAEIITPPAGFTLAQCYAPSIVAQCVGLDGITPAPAQNWTATETDGVWSFAAPVAPTPTLAQAAAALVAAGLTVTSTSTPALNGVYNVQSGVSFGQQDIATEAQFISTFSEFSNGTTTALGLADAQRNGGHVHQHGGVSGLCESCRAVYRCGETRGRYVGFTSRRRRNAFPRDVQGRSCLPSSDEVTSRKCA